MNNNKINIKDISLKFLFEDGAIPVVDEYPIRLEIDPLAFLEGITEERSFMLNAPTHAFSYRRNVKITALEVALVVLGLRDYDDSLTDTDITDDECVQIKHWFKEEHNLDVDLDFNTERPWLYTKENGKQAISILNCVYNLIEKFHFITVGEVKHEMLYYHEGVYKQGGELIIKRELQNKIAGFLTIKNVNEVIEHIKRETYTERKELNGAPSNLINFKNGVLDLNNRKLLTHSPVYKFVSQFNAHYNVEADCPIFKKFITNALSEKDVILIQEYMAHILFERNVCRKKALVNIGVKDTGKTTFGNTFCKLVGTNNISGLSIQMLGDKFAVQSMENKHLNYVDDLSDADVRDRGAVKMATGGGYMTVEKKFGDRYTIKPFAKHIWNCNQFPSVVDVDDDAYFGRFILIFWNNVVKAHEIDLTLDKKMQTEEELSGIVNWVLDGYDRLIENDFSLHRTIEWNKGVMQRSNSTVAALAQDWLSEGDKQISKQDLYNLYVIYCNENGGARITKEKFGREIVKYASHISEGSINNGKTRVWRNLSIKINNIKEITKQYNYDFNDLTETIKLSSTIKETHDENKNKEQSTSVVEKNTSQNENINKTNIVKKNHQRAKKQQENSIQPWEHELTKVILEKTINSEDILAFIKNKKKTTANEILEHFGHPSSIRVCGQLEKQGKIKAQLREDTTCYSLS